jgi:carbonic anhydrase
VNAQVAVLIAKTSIVQNAWRNGQDLTLHGWTYGLNSGYVTDLGVNMGSNSETKCTD